jgi:hypothetical protein
MDGLDHRSIMPWWTMDSHGNDDKVAPSVVYRSPEGPCVSLVHGAESDDGLDFARPR